jgi:hypothetical protein
VHVEKREGATPVTPTHPFHAHGTLVKPALVPGDPGLFAPGLPPSSALKQRSGFLYGRPVTTHASSDRRESYRSRRYPPPSSPEAGGGGRFSESLGPKEPRFLRALGAPTTR